MAKDAKAKVRSAQYDVIIAAAATLLAAQIHFEGTKVERGTLLAWPLMVDGGAAAADMGAVRLLATSVSLKKEVLMGLTGNVGITLRNAHQLPFTPESIERSVQMLIGSLFENNGLFLMRLRESEAKIRRGGEVAGGLRAPVAKEVEANARPPLVVAKVAAPVSGKRGMVAEKRVNYLMGILTGI